MLAGMMVLSVTACGNNENTGNSGSSGSTGNSESTDNAASTNSAGSTENTESPAESEPEAKPVELTVTTTFAGEDTNAQNYKDAVKAWEESTGNTVVDTSATANETFKMRVTTDFETGSEPDVLFFFNGADANSFIEAGKVVSYPSTKSDRNIRIM